MNTLQSSDGVMITQTHAQIHTIHTTITNDD